MTLHLSKELKTICWGSPEVVPPPGWMNGIKFNEPEEPTSYGLKVDEQAPKNFLMALQGVFLKQLLFSDSEGAEEKNEKSMRSYM